MEGADEQTRLAQALEALDAVQGDLELLLRERPQFEDLRPYLEVAASLTEIREGLAGGSSDALRASLIEQARHWRDKQA